MIFLAPNKIQGIKNALDILASFSDLPTFDTSVDEGCPIKEATDRVRNTAGHVKDIYRLWHPEAFNAAGDEVPPKVADVPDDFGDQSRAAPILQNFLLKRRK